MDFLPSEHGVILTGFKNIDRGDRLFLLEVKTVNRGSVIRILYFSKLKIKHYFKLL